MKKENELIKMLFSDDDRKKILTDSNGKVLKTSFKEELIEFAPDSGESIKDGEVIKAVIGDISYCAEAVKVVYEGDIYYLWTLKDIVDSLKCVGRAGSVVNMTYMLSKVETDMESIVEALDKNDNALENSAVIKKNALDFLKNAEISRMIANAIYRPFSLKNVVFNLGEALMEITQKAKVMTARHGADLLYSYDEKLNDMMTKQSREYFEMLYYIIIKKALQSSTREYISVTGECKEKTAVISFKFIFDKENCVSVVENDIEFFACRMYLEETGGAIDIKNQGINQQIDITVPLHFGFAFNAPQFTGKVNKRDHLRIFLENAREKTE